MVWLELGRRRRDSTIVVVAALMAVAAFLAAADRGLAGESAPVRNGLIAFQLYGDDASPDDGVYVVSADGNGRRRVAHQLPGSAEPRWSPDGTKLLILSVTAFGQRLYVIHPDGTARQTLVAGQLGGQVPGYASWSPDGRQIAFARGRVCDRIVCGAGLYVLSLATRTVRKVAGNVSGISPPAWSPDGRLIAYTGADDGRLYLARPTGRSVRLHMQLQGLAAFPAWTHDSRRLIFTLLADTPRSYVIAVDGRRLERILRPGDAAADWSPDGHSLVFSRGSTSGDIYVASNDGRHARRVTHDPRDETLPDWQSTR